MQWKPSCWYTSRYTSRYRRRYRSLHPSQPHSTTMGFPAAALQLASLRARPSFQARAARTGRSLPPRPPSCSACGGQGLQETLSVQVDRCMGTIESLENSLLKYIYAQNAPPVLRG